MTPQSSVIYRYQLNPNNKKRSIDNTENIENLVYHVDDKPCPFCRKLCKNDHGVKVHITHEHCCKICTKYKLECNGNHDEEEIQKHNISIKRKIEWGIRMERTLTRLLNVAIVRLTIFFLIKRLWNVTFRISTCVNHVVNYSQTVHAQPQQIVWSRINSTSFDDEVNEADDIL